MIGIIIAMDKELAPYLSGREFVKNNLGGLDFFTLKIGDKDCVIVKSGIGKVNASYATTLLIERFHPEYIVSTGVSGGLGVSKLFDIVVSTKTVQHDVDTTALGDELGLVSTVNKVYFDASSELVDKFVKFGAKSGVLASGDIFVSSKERAEFIKNHFNAIACDMESGAIAQIAYITNTPYVAIRCISDNADDGADFDYEKFVLVACDKLNKIVTSALTSN